MTTNQTQQHYLIAGAGFVGGQLVKILESTGHKVTPVTRSACDLTDAESVQTFAKNIGTHIDGIVHCASSSSSDTTDREAAYRSIYLEGCRHLLAAFQPDAFIFTSSTSVYAQTDGSTVTEDSPADPRGATGKILRQTEDEILAAGFTVARLAGIYGPGRSFLLKKYLEENSVIDGTTPDSNGRWINQIHRDDAASALAFLLEKRPPSQIYNVSDSTPLLQRDCYRQMAERFDKDIPEVAPPDPNRKRGWSDKSVSNQKLIALGWAPAYPSYFDALDAGTVSP
jgi:nucleoside-diphosphate-sugar epimerase